MHRSYDVHQELALTYWLCAGRHAHVTDVCHIHVTWFREGLPGSVFSTTHEVSLCVHEDGPWAHPRANIGTQTYSQCDCSTGSPTALTHHSTPQCTGVVCREEGGVQRWHMVAK